MGSHSVLNQGNFVRYCSPKTAEDALSVAAAEEELTTIVLEWSQRPDAGLMVHGCQGSSGLREHQRGRRKGTSISLELLLEAANAEFPLYIQTAEPIQIGTISVSASPGAAQAGSIK
jgi:hypothetical protein